MKQIEVVFANKKLELQFEKLQNGKFDEKQLHFFIKRAIVDLKNKRGGIKITKTLWPDEYIKKCAITNLWKYDLPNGWRLIYTIKEDEVMILNVILEWFDHKEYERRFKY